MLVTLAQPMKLPTPDGAPVRVAVMLVSSADSETRLATFARIARLASYGVAEELCAAKTAEQARSLVEGVESLW